MNKEIKKNSLREFLTTKGVFKIKFHEFKSPLLNTVLFISCTFINKNGIRLARGISLCSLMDTFNRRKGKDIAFKRAKDALINEKDSLEIEPRNINKFVKRIVKFNEKTCGFEVMQHLLDNCRVIDRSSEEKIIYSMDVLYPLVISKWCGLEYKSEFQPEKEIEIKNKIVLEKIERKK